MDRKQLKKMTKAAMSRCVKMFALTVFVEIRFNDTDILCYFDDRFTPAFTDFDNSKQREKTKKFNS